MTFITFISYIMLYKFLTALFSLLAGAVYSQTPAFSYLPQKIKAEVTSHDDTKNLEELSFSFDVQGVHEPIEISWEAPDGNMYNYWTPGGAGNIRPSWSSNILQSSATVLASVGAILDTVSNNRYKRCTAKVKLHTCDSRCKLAFNAPSVDCIVK